jgi:hypothetical protein
VPDWPTHTRSTSPVTPHCHLPPPPPSPASARRWMPRLDPPPPPPVSSAPPSAAAQPSFDAPRHAPPLSFSTCSPSVRYRSKQSPPTSTRCLCPPPPYTARCHRLHSRALIGASPPPSVPHLHAAACAEPALNVVAHAQPGIVGFCRGPCLALFRTPLPPSAGPPATGPRATAAQAAAPPVIGAELSCCF